MRRLRSIGPPTLLALVLLARGPADVPPRAVADAAPISVRIVPTTYGEKGKDWISLGLPGRHFHVVVTNTSQLNIRLWREWCSWGYFNLTFLVTDETGRTGTVVKADRDWTMNYPDPATLPPGGQMIFEVTLDEADWKNPPPKRDQRRAIKMQAIYEISADEQTKKYQVWTGRVASPEGGYDLSR